MQPVPITTKVVSSSPAHGEVGALDTTLCDKICQWLAAGWCLSPGTPIYSTKKKDRHDIAEILLKVALNIIIPNQTKPNQTKRKQLSKYISKTILRRIYQNYIKSPLMDLWHIPTSYSEIPMHLFPSTSGKIRDFHALDVGWGGITYIWLVV